MSELNLNPLAEWGYANNSRFDFWSLKNNSIVVGKILYVATSEIINSWVDENCTKSIYDEETGEGTLTLNSNVTVLDENNTPFEGNDTPEKLDTIDLEKSKIKELKDFAIKKECKKLILPEKLTKISSAKVFAEAKVEEIKVPVKNKVYTSGTKNTNAVIEKATKTLVAGCKTTIIPSDTKVIAKDAFYKAELKTITIPKSVKKIEEKAFEEAFEKENPEIQIIFESEVPPTLEGSLTETNEGLTITVPDSTAYEEEWSEVQTLSQSHRLTIHYINRANNESISDDHIETLSEGETYSVQSPTITGYDIYRSNQGTISGTMGDSDIVVNVEYTAKWYTVTINCIDASNNQVFKTTSLTKQYNQPYEITPEELDDTTCSDSPVSGIMPAENITISFTYTISKYHVYFTTVYGTITINDVPVYNETIVVNRGETINGKILGAYIGEGRIDLREISVRNYYGNAYINSLEYGSDEEITDRDAWIFSYTPTTYYTMIDVDAVEYLVCPNCGAEYSSDDVHICPYDDMPPEGEGW